MRGYLSVVFRAAMALLVVLFRDTFSPIIVSFSAYLSYLSLIPFGADLNMNVLSIGTKAINYVEACAAVGAYVFLALLILFTRNINLKKGIKMFLLGALLILVANIIRIDVLAYLLVQNNVNLFLTLHILTWKLLSGLYVALVWIFLVKKFSVKEIPIVSDFKYLKKGSLL
ncbi:pacearchaeosortase [Candidatus Woesearchaeota archaeon]|jgi:exosortase/archaeosortase family protein|nr:pacearchaeosortase [Candidatus Woesearchaeota archaeon]MBT6044878.1 pacearchaeosortase [Candidatus Woesearchaeota archaeon]